MRAVPASWSRPHSGAAFRAAAEHAGSAEA